MILKCGQGSYRSVEEIKIHSCSVQLLWFGLGTCSRSTLLDPCWCLPSSCSHVLSHVLTLFVSHRFKKLILHQPSTRASVEFIHALRASLPQDQRDAAAWCAQRMVAVLSSIKKPSVEDVKVFVNIAKTEGLAFFSDTCVQVDESETRLTRRVFQDFEASDPVSPYVRILGCPR